MNDMELLKSKRDYLNSLRPFSTEELQENRNNFVILNTRNESSNRKGKLNEEKTKLAKNNWQKTSNKEDDYDYMEIIGILKAYDFIQNAVDKENLHYYNWSMSEHLLKWINRVILEDGEHYHRCHGGHYRPEGINCYINDIFGNRLPLPENTVFLSRLRMLMKWNYEIQDDYITKLATFHLKFENDIHPFYDGNGRTGRMAMNFELAREGFPLISIKYTDEELYNYSFKKYRETYKIDEMKKIISLNIDSQLDHHILVKQI